MEEIHRYMTHTRPRIWTRKAPLKHRESGANNSTDHRRPLFLALPWRTAFASIESVPKETNVTKQKNNLRSFGCESHQKTANFQCKETVSSTRPIGRGLMHFFAWALRGASGEGALGSRPFYFSAWCYAKNNFYHVHRVHFLAALLRCTCS
jgi:hypothetical protein